MRFNFTADQFEFATGLRDLLERQFTATHLRTVWNDGTGTDIQLWRRLAEMGVLGMMVPESDGGLGGDFVDAIMLIEELGRAAVPGPVLETMTIGALALAGTQYAAGIASGTTTVTAALMGERYVPHRADVVLLADVDGVRIVESVDAVVAEVEGIDGGRVLTTVAGVHGVGGVVGEFVAADSASLFDAGALAAAAYLLGVSSRLLVIAGDYARDRRQFGQPIGSFQAVKHLMADALLKVEFARPAVYRVAWSHATASDDRSRDASMAKALASDAAQKAARSALQVHGAIGYTWECDLHMFMKKAWALIPAWGSAQFHRRRVADAVLGARPTFHP